MNMIKKILAAFMLACLILGGSGLALAAEGSSSSADLDKILAETSVYLLKTVQKPQVGPVGGEWAVVGLARSGCKVPPDWYEAYYKNLEDSIFKKQGVLHDKKYSEYSRVVLALTAMGKDPADVGGYNLLEKLGDLDKVLQQGINGPILALLAFDAGNYTIPDCAEAKIQATREGLLGAVTKLQLTDGGFSLSGEEGDPDLTGLALQALAPYRERAEVKEVIGRALACLSNLQSSDGGYTSYWKVGNVESDVQVLVALTALGIDPVADNRFIKNGKTIIEHLLCHFVHGGGFKHILDQPGADGMATEQAFYGLVAYDRFLKGKNSLYGMTDVQVSENGQNTGPSGLPGKNTAVTACPIRDPGKTFEDIGDDKEKASIEALASRGIISGVSDTSFEPGRTMTRAEFAAIVVQALGLAPSGKVDFTDVAATSWYAAPVATAYAYGIVRGTSMTTFSPEGTITREQAAVMVARAAELCGMNTAMTDTEIRDLLAQFPDYPASSTWAKGDLAFCYKQGFLSPEVLHIKPQEAITRSEIAAMLHRMLQKAALL